MIMLRSTRLCVYSKVLVPFEAYFVSTRTFLAGKDKARELLFFHMVLF